MIPFIDTQITSIVIGFSYQFFIVLLMHHRTYIVEKINHTIKLMKLL